MKGGYWELEDELIFDSNFESGNLDFVGKISDNEYDLMMRSDSNTKSHHCWFYFSAECKTHCKTQKGTKIKINVLNFTKQNSLFMQVIIAFYQFRVCIQLLGQGKNVHCKVSAGIVFPKT